MEYRLLITERASSTLNSDLAFLIKIAKAPKRAKALMDELESVFTRIIENPHQFPLCMDESLGKKEIRKAVLTKTTYVVYYDLSGSKIYIRAILSSKQDRADLI